MKKYLLIYHSEDNDGVFSGALFYDYLTNGMHVNKDDIERLPSTYNTLSDFIIENPLEVIQDRYENIIMTDISFNDMEYMQGLADIYGQRFSWCDHHKPVIEKSIELGFAKISGVRDITKSAILCVYEYLYDVFNNDYRNHDIPVIFRILSSWDSWSWKQEGYEFEYVKAVNKAVTFIYNLDFDKVIDVVHNIISHWIPSKTSVVDLDYLDYLYDYGNMIIKYEDQVMENIIESSGDMSWIVKDQANSSNIYRKACAIFHQGSTNSTMFKSLKTTHPEISNGLVFKHCSNGNWVLSMYNIYDDDTFDCGQFLKDKYNGGGHKGAAGCTFTEEEFIKILHNKKI